MKSNGLVEGMDMANLGYSTLQVNISMSAKICVFFLWPTRRFPWFASVKHLKSGTEYVSQHGPS
jgi:hypothetical protein